MNAVATARHGAGQAVLGAVDQLALAGANFLLGVGVARLGGVTALGAFAFAYALLVLVNMAHQALIAEIYSVAPEVPAAAARYGALPIAMVTLALALLSLGLIGVASLFSQALREQVWTPAFACALLANAGYASVKPFFYRQSRPWVVLASTAVYAAGMLGSAACGYVRWGAGWQPMWSIAIGSLLASLPLWLAIKTSDRDYRSFLCGYLGVSLRYAAWALPAAVLIWINSNGYMFTMPLLGDTKQSGALRAVLNLVAPVNTLLVGACTAWLPALARMHRDGDAASYRRHVHRIVAIAAGAVMLGAVALGPLSGWAVALIYGERYAGLGPVLRVAAFLPALWVAASIYRAAIRARADTRSLFLAYAFALFPIGLGLMAWLSPLGAAAAVKGMLATQALVVVAFIYFFNQRAGMPR